MTGPHLLSGAAFFGAVLLACLPANAQVTERGGNPACAVPGELTQITMPLERVARRVAAGEAITVVAIGSSSTAGAGASSPNHSYPSRLQVALAERFPGIDIRVLNRGVNGEDAQEMLARFSRSVVEESPDLVLWQVGTNAVLRDHNLVKEAPLIREGVRQLKETGADVVLIDPQFAPKVLAKPDHDDMVDLIGLTARNERAGVFHRFSVMRHWYEVSKIPFEQSLSPDGLHMNDWSYDCIAQLLAGAIADSVRLSTMSARLKKPAP